MPTFTITKDGQTLNTVTLEGERIELGSANTCKLFIDDLLISLHQAAFLKSPSGYDIEPIARTPAFTMNGEKVSERTALVPGAVIAIEGYEIRVDAGTGGTGSSAAPAIKEEPALPEPLAPIPESLPPLPPIEEPKAAPPPAPKPEPPPLPPLPPIDEPPPPKAQPPKERSQPPLPPPLPPIPEPLSAMDAPPKGQSRPLSSEPPPLPPLPPLEPPPAAPKPKPGGEAPTQYVIPVKPIGNLVVTKGPLKGKSWPLTGSELRIGREQGQNDILVRFDAKGEIDTSISRRHASIHIEGDYAFVEDQGSVAGTFVNGRQAGKGERIPLRSGDEVEIRSAKESTVFRVELGDSPAPVVQPPLPPPMPEPSYAPPPPKPAPIPAPQYAPPPEPPQRESRREEREPSREREPIRRRERRGGFDEDNPFAPAEVQGMPQWVWFAIGGAVVVIVLILVFVFI